MPTRDLILFSLADFRGAQEVMVWGYQLSLGLLVV